MAEIATLVTGLSALAGAGAAGYSAVQASKKPTLAPPPKPADPVALPDEEDPRVKAERDRKIRDRASAGGRDSTNLTGNTDYTGTTLGN